MELLGELPAEYIEAASKPQPKPRHIRALRYGIPAMAACMAVVIFAAVYPRLKSPEIPSVSTEPDITIVTESAATDSTDVTTAADEETTGKPEHTDSQGHRTTQTSTVSTVRSESESVGSQDTQNPGMATAEPVTKPSSSDTKDTHTSHTDASSAASASTASSSGTTRTTVSKPPQTTTGKSSTSGTTTSKTTTAKPSTTITTKPTALSTKTTSPKTSTTRRTTIASTDTAVRTTRTSASDHSYASTMSSTASHSSSAITSVLTTLTTVPYTIASTESTAVTSGSSSAIPNGYDSYLMQWQLFNPDAASDELDISWEILREAPGGDDYIPMHWFDFGRFDCLVIHLKTHATDADLTDLTIDRSNSIISGLVFRQNSDQTQRHFVFATAVPKGYVIDNAPQFQFSVTDQVNDYYTLTNGEPEIRIS